MKVPEDQHAFFFPVNYLRWSSKAFAYDGSRSNICSWPNSSKA